MASLPISKTKFPNQVFTADILKIKERVLFFTNIASDTVDLIIDYLKNDGPFGRAEWLKYCNADPGPEPELTQEFYRFWYGPDPIDPTKRVCETHIPPIFRPRFFTHLKTRTLMAASLQTLAQLGLQYLDEKQEALLENKDKKAGPGCWLVMRKDVLARGESINNQRALMKNLNKTAGYEEIPSVIDLAFLVFARGLLKEEYHLGRFSGQEKEKTFSLCEEVYEEVYGIKWPLVIGCFTSHSLSVNCIRFPKHKHIGIAALWKV